VLNQAAGTVAETPRCLLMNVPGYCLVEGGKELDLDGGIGIVSPHG